MKSVDILGANTYHVVVGNPPYITVKDKAENENYRERYETLLRHLRSLGAVRRTLLQSRPSRRRLTDAEPVYVGQITANSFMKREFGKKLIEEFFRPKVNLTHVIDTSGAYIPGHGTPTVILVGRNMIPTIRPIRAVLGVRGEPRQPSDPAKGSSGEP